MFSSVDRRSGLARFEFSIDGLCRQGSRSDWGKYRPNVQSCREVRVFKYIDFRPLYDCSQHSLVSHQSASYTIDGCSRSFPSHTHQHSSYQEAVFAWQRSRITVQRGVAG